MKSYRVAIVGVGVVGQEIYEILKERSFPMSSCSFVGRKSRKQQIQGSIQKVQAIEKVNWKDFDIALFAGTEGEKGASVLYGWKAVEGGCTVIDNGDDFRMDDRVPLVIPEINSEALKNHQGLIANPNCSTIQMAMALWPLHQKFILKEAIVSTYQAVSGSGREGIEELKSQMDAFSKKEKIQTKCYNHPILSNAIPQISSLVKEYPGYYKEEVKMIRETRKIFEEAHLAISATCVRVPVFNCHSETITAKFEKNITPKKATQILESFPGIEVLDDPENGVYPLSRSVSGSDSVYVGRIRQSTLGKNTLEMWVVSDNLRKGAALNAIQIAEKVVQMEK